MAIHQPNQCTPLPTTSASPSPPPVSKRARPYSSQDDTTKSTSQRQKLPNLTGNDQGCFTWGCYTSSDSAKEQLNCVSMIMESPMEVGDAWYLVSITWVSKWKQYCRFASSSGAMNQQRCLDLYPGAVNNKSLLHTETQQLLPNLVEDTDFISIPEIAWHSLEKWYGKSDTPLKRYVIDNGSYIKMNVLEIYPATFYVYVTLATGHELRLGAGNSKPVINLSTDTPLEHARYQLLAAHHLAQDTPIRTCWVNKFMAAASDLLVVSSLVLHQAPKVDTGDPLATIGDNCFDDSALMMDLSPYLDNWIDPSPQSSLTLPSTSSSPLCAFGTGFIKDSSVSGVLLSPILLDGPLNSAASDDLDTLYQHQGICGLVNLGNTCFMNSALQCLSNTPQLSRWFLANNHTQDLNRDNPLGMHGALAEGYGHLIQQMWDTDTELANPKQLKLIINQFSPLFTGYQQHDSQELLAFLLDGLHEDTNRILDKPYKELSDFGDVPDREIAKASWDYHKARNDSVIVDLFQGQFKSRLVCNVCQKVSVTFDPFMYLSLPLPTDMKCHIEIIFVPYDTIVFPQHMILTLDNDATIVDLKAATANLADLTEIDDLSTLLVLEIYNDNIYKVFLDFDLVTSIQPNDGIYIYQLPGSFSPDAGHQTHLGAPSSSDGGNNHAEHSGCEWIVFPVYCSTLLDYEEYGPGYQQFGGPLILAIQVKYAHCVENVYRLIAKHLERYTRVRLFRDVYFPGTMQDPPTPISPSSPLIDSTLLAQQQPKRIDHLEPISNLFSMNIFSAVPDDNVSKNNIPHTDGDWRRMLFEDMEDRLKDLLGGAKDTPEATNSQHPSPFLSPLRTAPSHTLIRQGEGILLDWDLRSAQDCFGIHVGSPEIRALGTTTTTLSTIDDSKWTTVSSLMDPPIISLTDCLDEFTKMEHLSEEDQWYCPQCKRHQPATKKFDLWRLPDILVIHLKRFDDRLHEKIHINIEFPLEALDMADRVRGEQDPPVYDLYAVDNHRGSMDSGHYTAFAQNWLDDKWYCYDDNRVSQIEKEDVQTDSAYLLFYNRRRC